MAEKPFAQRVSLAVQDAIYKVADDLTTIVDEALEAFEDAAARVEEKVTPVYNYTVNVNGEVSQVVDKIKEEVERQRAQHAPSQTGGSETTPTTLEEALSVVYDYLRDSNQLGEVSPDKDNQLHGNKSGIAGAFKTAVAKKILGSAYYKGVESKF